MKNLKYSKIELSDNARYRQYLSLCKDVPADICTSLLWGYSNFDSSQRAYADDLCWQQCEENGETVQYPPVGDWDRADWSALFDKYVTPGTVFDYVPGCLKEQWEAVFPGRFEISTDRNTWDYIYDLELFSSDTETKRRYFRHFNEKYRYTVVPITADNIDDVIRFNDISDERIKEIYSGKDDLIEMEEDEKAMRFILHNWESFDSVDGILLRAEGRYISYMIWDVIDDRIVALFGKNSYEYVGVHEAVIGELCGINMGKGRKWVNYTCDAGFEGLRKAKMIRNPARLLEKYRMVWLG